MVSWSGVGSGPDTPKNAAKMHSIPSFFVSEQNIDNSGRILKMYLEKSPPGVTALTVYIKYKKKD